MKKYTNYGVKTHVYTVKLECQHNMVRRPLTPRKCNRQALSNSCWRGVSITPHSSSHKGSSVNDRRVAPKGYVDDTLTCFLRNKSHSTPGTGVIIVQHLRVAPKGYVVDTLTCFLRKKGYSTPGTGIIIVHQSVSPPSKARDPQPIPFALYYLQNRKIPYWRYPHALHLACRITQKFSAMHVKMHKMHKSARNKVRQYLSVLLCMWRNNRRIARNKVRQFPLFSISGKRQKMGEKLAQYGHDGYGQMQNYLLNPNIPKIRHLYVVKVAFLHDF